MLKVNCDSPAPRTFRKSQVPSPGCRIVLPGSKEAFRHGILERLRCADDDRRVSRNDVHPDVVIPVLRRGTAVTCSVSGTQRVHHFYESTIANSTTHTKNRHYMMSKEHKHYTDRPATMKCVDLAASTKASYVRIVSRRPEKHSILQIPALRSMNVGQDLTSHGCNPYSCSFRGCPPSSSACERSAATKQCTHIRLNHVTRKHRNFDCSMHPPLTAVRCEVLTYIYFPMDLRTSCICNIYEV